MDHKKRESSGTRCHGDQKMDWHPLHGPANLLLISAVVSVAGGAQWCAE